MRICFYTLSYCVVICALFVSQITRKNVMSMLQVSSVQMCLFLYRKVFIYFYFSWRRVQFDSIFSTLQRIVDVSVRHGLRSCVLGGSGEQCCCVPKNVIHVQTIQYWKGSEHCIYISVCNVTRVGSDKLLLILETMEMFEVSRNVYQLFRKILLLIEIDPFMRYDYSRNIQ